MGPLREKRQAALDKCNEEIHAAAESRTPQPTWSPPSGTPKPTYDFWGDWAEGDD
jgi:hypothetical protein